MLFQIYIMFISERLPRTPIYLFTSSLRVDKFNMANIRSLLDRETIRRLTAQLIGGDRSPNGGDQSGDPGGDQGGQTGKVVLEMRQASGGVVSLSFRSGAAGAKYSYVGRTDTYYNAVTTCRRDGGVLACPKNYFQNYIITATQIQ